ncbi:hypothetical protein F5Y05DRAFT_410524 [Hypoxylon sp. FL0543]|nr:hypothetical protein F5Y05DRAFT_410524 [Hypoxylon sp. FL0543]
MDFTNGSRKRRAEEDAGLHAPRRARIAPASPSPPTVREVIMQVYPRMGSLPLPGDATIRLLLDAKACNSVEEVPPQASGSWRAPPFFRFDSPGWEDKLLALCVQACGSVKSGPEICLRCRSGNGVWGKCVVAPSFAELRGDALRNACACCYYHGGAEPCSFARQTTIAAASASSGPVYLTVASRPSGPQPSGYVDYTTQPADPLLVAYHRSMSTSQQQRMDVKLSEAQTTLDEELRAVVDAEKEPKDNDSASSGFGNPLLAAYYRSQPKAMLSETRKHLQGALAQVESQLAALAAAMKENKQFQGRALLS